MSLPLIIALLGFSCFSILTISSSIREEKLRKRLQELETERTRRDIEEKLFGEIHQSIDHSLDVQKIVSLITEKLNGFLPYTTTSALIVKEHKLIFTAFAAQPVPYSYIEEIKEAMLQSLVTLENRSYRDVHITEEITGDVSDDPNPKSALSLFHLPLMLHNCVAAIITISSTKSEAFSGEDVAALQHVITRTSQTISKLDAALQTEKSRLTAMIEGLFDGLLMIDIQNNLQIINPAARHLLSLHKEHPTTMDVLSALPIHYDFQGKIQQTLRHNQHVEMNGIVIKNKQLGFRIAPVKDTTGTVVGVSVLMRDETLNNAVPRMKEDFTNILVHELRNPLTSIKASSELLISPVTFSKDEQTKLIHVIYQQSNKLLSEVQQILDAAKLESGVFTIHKSQGDLKQLLKEVATVFLPEAQEKLINFVVDVDHTLPAFSFDTNYLTQAISNIISNSIKFTATGGTVQLSAKQKHGTVVITIADTGSGIPKDKQFKLFNKFSQFEQASASIGKGLGLYLVKGIMEAHGGKVDLDSDSGRGTTIFLTLPLAEATHQPVSSLQKHNEPHRVVN